MVEGGGGGGEGGKREKERGWVVEESEEGEGCVRI